MPRSRIDTIPLIAGRPVLDLVNTISWRGAPDRSEDHLQRPADCLTWARRSGILSEAETTDLRRRLARRPDAEAALASGLRRLRDVATEAVLHPTTKALDAAKDVILDALQHSDLGPPDVDDRADAVLSLRWRVSGLDENTVARRLALDLDALLQSTVGRIGVCADAACQWVFIDTSRGQNRQWCSPTDCGNRHRVQRHHERSRRG